MPWKQTDAMEERIRYVVRAERQRSSLGELSAEFGIHRTTGWRWRKRLEQIGRIEDLGEHSRRPRRSPNQIRPEVQQRILELRQKHGWGALKLGVLLEREGCSASVATINRVLARNGAVRPEDSHRPAFQRFERSAPNQLWQMDFKGMRECMAARYGTIYPLSILDDHSRFLVGLFALRDPNGELTLQCLRRVFEPYGLPEAMLMDHGTPWWSTSNGHGLTHLAVALMKQGIRLYFSGIRHPQTQGKVERLHRTMQQALEREGEGFPGWEAWTEKFRQEYNQVRPHQALAMAVPAERYQPSGRVYRDHPPPWEYESGAQVRRLNSQGCVKYRSERYFVCEALAGEEVVVEALQERILVRYRQTYVREIDVETGRTRPMVIPRQAGSASGSALRTPPGEFMRLPMS
jgi:transposase InsO family protein